jgi:hypothetical protein
MALQYSSTICLARLDQVETSTGTSPKLRIFSGSAPANCAAADSGTLLAELTLPSDWMNAASGTTKTLLGSWTGTASGGAGATPTHFRIWNSGATVCHVQGSCGIGSGDLQVNGTITSGQTVTVTSFTLTAANT